MARSRIRCPGCDRHCETPAVIPFEGFEFSCPACGCGWTVAVAVFSKVLDHESFRRRLRRGVQRLGYSHKTLADLLGVSPAYVSMVLAGKRVPTDPRRWLEAVGIHGSR